MGLGQQPCVMVQNMNKKFQRKSLRSFCDLMLHAKLTKLSTSQKGGIVSLHASQELWGFAYSPVFSSHIQV